MTREAPPSISVNAAASGVDAEMVHSSEVTEHVKARRAVEEQNRVLEMITGGAPLTHALDFLLTSIERQSNNGMMGSILLLDKDGTHLRHGAAPSLPKAYNAAIDGIAIGPDVGSCGTAAYTKESVIVSDIATDPLWKDFRALALRHGLRACWSTPLCSGEKVLGTFAMYYRDPHTPTEEDRRTVEFATRTAILAIERERAEEALRESERRFRAMIDALPTAIYTTDAEGRLTHFNPAAVAFSGRVPELGTDQWCVSWKLYYPDGTPMPHEECPMAIALKEGRVIHGAEAIAERPDGTRVWFVPYPTPLRDAKGRVFGGINMLMDITERKRAEEVLRESEEKFRTLADNMSQFAWMTDETGWIFWYNQRWYEYTGTTLEEMQGWGWQSVHHPDHVDRVIEKIRRCFETGEEWEDTFPLRGKDGGYRWFLSRAVPVRDGEGRIVRWFGTNTDITAQRALERQKDKFIGIASHELKTPVTSIKGYVQLLERRFRNARDAPAEMLAKLDGQINRLTGLIEDLLDVTRIESEKLLFRPSPFDLNGLIDEIVEEVQRTTDRHTIVQELAASVTLVADRDRIGQVLTNLLTNAIKYSPRADRVVVKTARDGGNIVVSVRDFGIGISAEKQPHIFERFFRVDEESRTGYPGLGLGLYISAEFVKRHGGAIWVESGEGEGTTVAFSLPLEQEDGRDRGAAATWRSA